TAPKVEKACAAPESSITAMKREEVWYHLQFHGDSMVVQHGSHNLHELTYEVICELPAEIQEWLFFDTQHIFYGGSGQLGEYVCLQYPRPPSKKTTCLELRLVFLS